MIVRALSPAGDWTFGKGKNNYLSKQKAIGQNIQTRLMSFLGDCFFDMGAGIDWFTLLGAKDKASLQLAVSAVILNTEDVIGLNKLLINADPRTRKITIQYSAVTIYTDPNTDSNVINSSTGFLTDQNGNVFVTQDGSSISV